MNVNILNQGRDLQNDKLNNAGSQMMVSRMTKTASENAGISVSDKDISGFGMEQLQSFEDVKSKASVKNVSLESNALAVMSNSLSGEDYAKVIEDGFSPADVEPGEMVTNLDKIKAKMAASGADIPGYTDDLTTEEIAQITGSVAYAQTIENALKDNYTEITEENVEAIDLSLKLSEKVTEPSDEAKKYIISNDLDLTVNNLYLANHSAVKKANDNKAEYYKDETGYVGKNPTETDFEELKPQIERIIVNSGLEINKKSLTDAEWLIKKNIPLTEENLIKLQDINSVSFPIKADVVARSAAAAIADGFDPKYADITNTESIAVKAGRFLKEANDEIDNVLKGKPETLIDRTGAPDEISARRILEETRLALTAEASISLIKKGIEIDTKDLQNLVEELKQAEKEYYEPFLMEEKRDSVDSEHFESYDKELTVKYDLFKQTVRAIDTINTAPEETFTDAVNASLNSTPYTLSDMAENAEALKGQYDRAGKSYETMMTVPRADLGDNIKKAFRNVDDILEDMNIEINSLNEKAVRILGYSDMQINEKNINAALKAETAVQNVINYMTPARTLKMIRDGENPLETDIYELSDKLVNEDEQLISAKYSEFIFKLEKSGDITEAEKTAFIGLYRLFNKIEKSDGKLVGDVLKSDAKLTLSNILSASRSDRQVGTDITVDDSFGLLEKLVSSGTSITDQILAGFKTKELNDKFYKEEAESVREMISGEEAVLDALENMNEPKSPVNMAAMEMLINDRGSLFRGIKDKVSSDDDREELDELSENIADSFEDEESVKAAYESLYKKTEEVIKKEAETADTYIDLKSLKLLNRQLSIVRSMADSRTYEVPVEIDGKLTSINLKLISDSENAGKVSASFETESTGRVSAEFTLKNGEVSGFVVTENTDFVKTFKTKEDSFKVEFKGAGVELSSMYYTSQRGLNIKGNYTDKNDSRTPATKQLYSVAKAIIKAVQK